MCELMLLSAHLRPLRQFPAPAVRLPQVAVPVWRRPLCPHEKGKPVARRGRKATGPTRSAGLPTGTGPLIRRALIALAQLALVVLAIGLVGPLRQAALATPALSGLIGSS